ncbi:hypothetical protein WCE02_03240 [Pseudomonas juntendi]|uniref:Uncharacterized protein n=1 Tax=Pseudomonas putida TaxID=303 RepID=A0A1X0ZU33_PSEPU|nr:MULTISPECIES: hypothetical protein [Pseudomonas]EKT4467660.1 hypothetical protein [Pseudomonas putida]EKT4520994.1 hypothetical protein [Pseudomonas putida]MEB3898705.1 hypothetical protein [Pseudomonas putida]ORL63086.1 hypothetical protein B7H17_16335 [Pseudomonas putida]UBM23274.1 hypothetical protein K8374_12740 [Pseudomonas sp. p1(2021b)]
MQRVQATSQEALDLALIAFYRFKIGEIKVFDLERAMSFEVGQALAQSGLVRFSITQMASGRYRISDQGEHSITEAGRARLEHLRG